VGIERLYLRNLAKLVETNKFTRRGLPVKGGTDEDPVSLKWSGTLSQERVEEFEYPVSGRINRARRRPA
jgi:hypothetical protein